MRLYRHRAASVRPCASHPFCIATLLTLVLFLQPLAALAERPAPTTPKERRDSFEKHKEMAKTSLFKNLAFRCVGPVVMGGRVVDIEPSPTDPFTFYVAYATGGLWKTSNQGMRFKPIFEGQNAITIGNIAVDQKNGNTIWVGTGEANSARSHYSGTGIYKTTDGGETWRCMGLEDSHNISRIRIHPKDSNIVFVAAQGHLYTKNEERGLFRTTDGGESWENVLHINQTTGVVDVVIDPQNPKIIYASTWQKDRRAWNVVESGVGSGVFKSTDGGDSWTRLTGGLPRDQYVGRIGLAISPSNPKVVYALLDNQTPQPDEILDGDARITARKLRHMTKEEVLALDDGTLENFLRRSGFHSEYKAKNIREKLESNEIGITDLLDYIVSLNYLALKPTVTGAEVYRSDDGGLTWEKRNIEYLNSMYNIAGYYYGQIRVAPQNEDQIYIMGLPLLTSTDGGHTYDFIGASNVHVDHHAFWIDPAHPNHYINGNDGGLNLTYDGGETWQKLNHVPVGQFYAINVDMAQPYNIYGGLQDNGTFKGSSRSKVNKTAEWERVSGGDGFYVMVAPDMTVYSGSQYGNYSRHDTNGSGARVKPGPPKMDEPPQQFNWQTPILLSTHSPNVVYYGSTRLYRSLDRGENLKPISPPLGGPLKSGNVPYNTLTVIAESKQTFGVLYAGTDDGRVHMTPDGGVTWKRLDRDLPQKLWVSRIETSHHTDGLVYLSLNAYRNDDFRTYIYRSEDYGKTWKSIKGNLPDESVNVIREDPKNEHVLYIGTDMGVFVSLDDGESWEALQNGIPISPAHDLVIHPRDRDLVVGTFGRSIYVMNVEPLQDLTPEIRKKPLHLFPLKDAKESSRWNRKPSSIIDKSDPLLLSMYAWMKKDGKIDVTVKDDKDVVLRSLEFEGSRGLNTLEWDFQVDRDVVLPKRLAAAEKDLEKAEKKLADARKKSDKGEESNKDEKDKSEPAKSEKKADETKKESEKKDANESTEAKKPAPDHRNLVAAIDKARLKVKSLQEAIDETQKYADSPQSVKDQMIRKTHITAGKYTVEIKANKQTESQELKITGGSGNRSDSSGREWEEEEEWGAFE